MKDHRHWLALRTRRERTPARFLLAIAVLVTPLAALAQIGSEGQISGYVRDQTGSVVSGATVTVTDVGTGQSRTTQTSAEGYYVLTNIPPGTYDISVEHQGFKKFVRASATLNPAGKLTADISLEVGAVNETLTVSAEAASVENSTAQVGRVIEGKQVLDLPLNGRQPVYLQAIKPGVIGPSPNNFTTGTGNGNFNVNGSRSNSNSFLLDGVQQVRTRSPDFNTGEITVDTIQEINIVTASYAPEFGRGGGGQTLVVTRSGTQNFHGSAWEFFRNTVLDANTWTNNHTALRDPFTGVTTTTPRPVVKFNQPGYAFGGPVFLPGKFNTDKQHLFFFWSQEWTRYHNEGSSRGRVPSDAVRAGNLSELGVPIKDPQGGNFTDAIIPESRMGAIGKAIVRAYPSANCVGCFPGSNDNFYKQGLNISHNRKDVLRLDDVQRAHRISFRYSGLYYLQANAFQGTFDFGPLRWPWNTYSGSLSVTSSLHPNLINEFNFGASTDIARLGVGGHPSRQAVGITYPYLFPGTKVLDDKIPTIGIDNFSTIDGGPYPGRSAGVVYTWTDSLTYVKERHTYKTGVYIERSGENDLDQINIVVIAGGANNQNGSFSFTNNRAGGTGVAVADALLGLFNSYQEISTKSYTPWRATGIEWFGQDSWKLRPHLTVEYGLRINYWPPQHSLWGNISSFNPLFYQSGLASVSPTTGQVTLSPSVPFDTARFNGITLPGTGWPTSAFGRVPAAADPGTAALFHGVPDGLSETHYAVDPRLGIAYGLNNKTAIRAGFGVYHTHLLLNDSTLLGGNAPMQLLATVQTGSAENPGAAAAAGLSPLGVNSQDPIFRIPAEYQWSLTVQREMPGRILLEVGYVGKRGLHLQRQIDLNAINPASGCAFQHPTVAPAGSSSCPGPITGNTASFANAYRPFQGYGLIVQSQNSASAKYNSLQASVTRRFHSGLGLNVAYTYSKSMDNASSYRTTLPNPFNDRHFWGPSDFDRTHVFVGSFNYQLPFGHGRRFLNDTPGIVNAVLGGWELAGISYLRTGSPFSVTSPVDALGVGGTSGAQFVSFLGPIHQLSPKLGGQLFDNPLNFTLPTPGTEGTEGRNMFRNPGFQNHDLAIYKSFHITEGKTLQFRAEAFNFVNHPNLPQTGQAGAVSTALSTNGMITSFTDPNYGRFANGDSRNFGIISGKTGDRRNIQLALKFVF